MVTIDPEEGESSVQEEAKEQSQVDSSEPVLQLSPVESSFAPMQPAAAADFSVTVHDDSTEQDDPACVSPGSNPSAANTPEKIDDTIQSTDHLPDADVDTSQLPETPKARGSRRRTRLRKRGRVVRAALVEEAAADEAQGLLLPSNQYETSLFRRATRKRDAKVKEASPVDDTEKSTANNKLAEPSANDHLEVYGDISLGMKLSVVGGKVIVQHLNALSDGRASPAQLTGVVRRGDVLLSIDGKNLVNLPIDQLMAGLGPLSTADATGSYQRTLKLRFAAEEGLELLVKSEASKGETIGAKADGQQRMDAVNDMFALFPMVDQLSGMPLFEEQFFEEAEVTNVAQDVTTDDEKLEQASKSSEIGAMNKDAPLDEMISYKLAVERILDRTLYTSEFYGWNEHVSDLLRSSVDVDEHPEKPRTQVLSLAELIELGRRAVLGAKALSKGLENVDRGLDVRSFRSWNSTISLYSRASTRRRYVLDAASLPVNFGKVVEEEEDDDEEGSAGSGDSDDEEDILDGDELLLRLASHDEIWRKQVVEFLESTIHTAEEESDDQLPEGNVQQTADIDSALSMELGSFLFGENMSKILTKNKKPQALPPEEITAVLFDLTTKVSVTVPDRITAAGSLVSYRSSLVPFTGIKRPPKESDAMLATQFLLREALPVWLKTFRPLPWDQRRVLWPLEKATSGESTAASTLSDDLTLDSFSTRQTTATSTARQKRKNLREMIEDQQLNVETRSETCFLVTYYFTQKMLPELLHRKESEEFQATLNETAAFVKDYGSYLKMHTCLAYSALLKAEEVIALLLEAAKYDPRHREMMKVTSKANALVFYEPTMLSTVVQRLHLIRTESAANRRLPTIDRCAAAFPDIRPWQVKKECVLSAGTLPGALEEELSELYYTYLSLLLHPHDGHKAARNDSSLVQEWCELSTCDSSDKTQGRRVNFFCVAARTSSDHLAYRRNLVMLLKCSMKIDEHDLALDLAGEVIDDPLLSTKKSIVDLVLGIIRDIGTAALDADVGGQRPQSERILKRIIRLHRKESMKTSLAASQSTNVSDELLRLLEHKKTQPSVLSSNPKGLVSFLATEAEPSDVLETLSAWTATSDTSLEVLPVLHTILRRGAHASMSSELSGALLSLKRARLRFAQESGDTIVPAKDEPEEGVSDQSIWKNMSTGMVVVAK